MVMVMVLMFDHDDYNGLDDDGDHIRNKVKMDDHWTAGGALSIIWTNHTTNNLLIGDQQQSYS